jgi:hypothetical protein
MNLIFNDRVINPCEHIPEPDNMIDFNDIPTAPVQNMFNFDGPLGMAFDGDNAVSSLLLVPLEPDTTRAESKLIADVGSFDYAYTRGLFTHRNSLGRSLKAFVSYRRATGADRYRDDETYHMWLEWTKPISQFFRVNASGRMYKREGEFPIRPELSGSKIDRFRRDRDLTATIDWMHGTSSRTNLEFRHQLSISDLEDPFSGYFRKFDFIDNSFSMIHDMKLGPFGTRFSITAAEEIFHDYKNEFKQYNGNIGLGILRGDSLNALTGLIRIEKSGEFELLPSGMLGYSHNGRLVHLSASAGYAVRFPRCYEMEISPRFGQILTQSTGVDYYEIGNKNLLPEKQLTGNLTFALGKAGSDFQFSATGGKIENAIDWIRFDTLGLELVATRPGNREIIFGSVSAMQNLNLNDRLIFSAGGSYRHVEIDKNDNTPYTPNYQLFSGLQLYHHIKKLDLHLYIYGEAMYHSIYHGYDLQEYGEKVIFNLKFSFRIKKFRFYQIFQDVPSIDYSLRENYYIPGRYVFYGVTWEFLD